MRIGSLFSGYAGLDMAVLDVLGGDVAWHCEHDPDASAVLAHHWPDVPNVGDITAVDWSGVEPVDVLAAGFPCQDVSSAGKRAGLRPGTRSGLWRHTSYAIAQLRPSLVIVENVRGLLSAEAHSSVEPCPWCVGDGEGEPPLRALGAVLGDLSFLGYDAVWCGLRAADVGAPHGRFRIFVVAAPRDSDGGHRHGRTTAGLPRQAGPTAGPVADARRDTRTEDDTHLVAPARSGGALADTNGNGVRQQPVAEPGCGGAPVAVVAGADATPADPAGTGRGLEQSEHSLGIAGIEPVRSREAESGRRGGASADADGSRRGTCEQDDGARQSDVDWGSYQPAIRRWEQILGRPAPAPTLVGRRGARQLNPGFVEWLMGLPAGHVTDVPGLSRNAKLRILGNGVVPQQAVAALGYLLPLLTPVGVAA